MVLLHWIPLLSWAIDETTNYITSLTGTHLKLYSSQEISVSDIQNILKREKGM